MVHDPRMLNLEIFKDPVFYFQLGAGAVALIIGWLFAAIVNWRLKPTLVEDPLRQPLYKRLMHSISPLLHLIFAMLLLAVAQAISEHFVKDAHYVTAIYTIVLAWLVAKSAHLLVKNRAAAFLIGGVVVLLTLLSVTNMLEPTLTYLDSFSMQLGKVKLSLLGVIKGALVCIAMFWLAGRLARGSDNYLRRVSGLSYNSRALINKLLEISFYMIAALVTLNAVGVDLTALAVIGGALGVGIGFGLQKITSNFISGIILLMEKSIKSGDLIDIGTISGTVRQMSMRYTVIETFEGSEVIVPNEDLIVGKVTNWTYNTNRARVSIPISITYESDLLKARELMIEIAREHPRTIMDPEPSCFLREFTVSGANFLLIFWVDDVTQGRFGPQNDVMFEILRRFKEEDITFPNANYINIRSIAPISLAEEN